MTSSDNFIDHSGKNSLGNELNEDVIHGHVLSIQSHVVHGYVGNRASVLPLQLLGFETDFINSVQFSNHTGYKVVKGQTLSGKELEELFDGLIANGLQEKYTHILTGYIGSITFLRTVLETITRLKKQNNGLIYVCDPVLGDNGIYYVPKDLIEIYRNEVIQYADIVTPNQFEAEELSGIKIQSEQDALKCVEWFHDKGVGVVILSSVEYVENELVMFASSKKTNEKYKISFKKIKGQFTGTGDVVSALTLAWMSIHTNDLKLAMEKTLAGIQCILSKTPTGEELRIIKCRNSIQNPNIIHSAQKI